MDWNKDHIRETMLSMETAALHSARDNYLDYVSTARLDRSEPDVPLSFHPAATRVLGLVTPRSVG